uniref:Uncharacterized protein n=1 Tax=Rhizophora mucronata TaxID=61149 RepID=A0A2P2Q970_RHIMU
MQPGYKRKQEGSSIPCKIKCRCESCQDGQSQLMKLKPLVIQL